MVEALTWRKRAKTGWVRPVPLGTGTRLISHVSTRSSPDISVELPPSMAFCDLRFISSAPKRFAVIGEVSDVDDERAASAGCSSALVLPVGKPRTIMGSASMIPST